MGEGLNKPLFSQRCLQTFFIFLSRELADVFEKNENKNKTKSVYRLWNSLPLDLRRSPFLIGFKKGLKTYSVLGNF